MQITTGTWNIKGGFGSQGDQYETLRAVKSIDADVMVLNEAHMGRENDLPLPLRSQLEDLGYLIYEVDRDPSDGREYSHTTMLHKAELDLELESVKLARRTGIIAVHGSGLAIVGVHFDDRSPLERLATAEALEDEVDLEGAVVLLTDMNDSDPSSKMARLLSSRLVKKVALTLPSEEDTPRFMPFRQHFEANEFRKLTEMAQGLAYQRLVEIGFFGVDDSNRPTVKLGPIPIAQIDHIMHTEGVKIVDGSFRRPYTLVSDHLPIVATIEV